MRSILHLLAALSLGLIMTHHANAQQVEAHLLTTAEATDYAKTTRYDDVIALLDRLESIAPNTMRRATMGHTVEGRAIPLAIFANPPVATASEAQATGKPIIFTFANIHAGEVCGKEAALMLARELAMQEPHTLLDQLIIVLCPIYNADGNEKMSPHNRPGQIGPDEMGTRPNAQNLDLNRDYIKLEAPETRALVRCFTDWNPHLSIDLHTTNGSRHRYTLTYDTPLHPSTPQQITRLLRDELLPAVTESVRTSHGYEMFYYGNFNRDHTTWSTYSALPRYGGNYQGVRAQAQILSEAYSYATFKDRVLCTLTFIRAIHEYAAQHPRQLIDAHNAAQAHRPDTIAIRTTPGKSSDKPVTVLGYALDDTGKPTDTPADHSVEHFDSFAAERTVSRPLGYLIPPAPGNESSRDALLTNLHLHGIKTQRFASTATVEQYIIDAIDRPQRPFQGHHLNRIDATAHTTMLDLPEGTIFIPTDQVLGALSVLLLEPESEDGLAAWNFLDAPGNAHIEVGKPYPILRVPVEADLAGQ